MKQFEIRNKIWEISCRKELGNITKYETKLWDIRNEIRTIGSYE